MATATMAATCGYCNTGSHHLCPVKIRRATKATADGMWTCPCSCVADRTPYCLECKHTGEGEIGPKSWSCIDSSACSARRQARLDSNPLIQQMNTLKEKRMSQTATEPKAPKAPKTGNCIHCGEVTKGGKFLPGHDAAFVSDQVGLVMTDRKNESKARAAMKDTSDALQKKFERSLELALAKADKQAAAAAAKKDADAAAKAEKAEKAAAAKAAKAEAKNTESVSDLLP